jgi:hypothetical protein
MMPGCLMENRPVNRAAGSPAGGSPAGGAARSSPSADAFRVASAGADQGREGAAGRLAQRAADSSLEGLSEARVDALARLLIRALDNENPAATEALPGGEQDAGDENSQIHPGIALYHQTQGLVK